MDALTSLRGLAAVLVVVYHFSGGFLPNLELGAYSDFVPKSYLWVDLFFVLSGFIITHAYGDKFAERVRWETARPFLFARMARIYPLHLFVLAAFALLELAKWGLEASGEAEFRAEPFEHAKHPGAIATNMMMLQAAGVEDGLTWNGPAWSVGAEWFAYLLFPFLILLVFRMGWIGRVLMLAAAGVGLALISDYGRNLDVTYDYGVLRCAFEFSLGVVLYLAYRSIPGTAALGRDAALAAVLAAILTVMHLGYRDILLVPLFGLLIVGLAAGGGMVERALSVRPLVWLGEISYSVYMSHIFVLELVDTGWEFFLDERFAKRWGDVESLGVLLLLLGVVILLSATLYRHVELPAREALKRSRFARRYVQPLPVTR